MNKRPFFSLFAFWLITTIFFFGGLLGIIFTIRHLYKITELEKSEIVEEAVITKVVMSYRSFTDTVYFSTTHDNKVYRFQLLNSYNVNVGDKIEVKFNEEKTFFLVEKYSLVVYISKILEIFLLLVCLILSIYFILIWYNDTYKQARSTN